MKVIASAPGKLMIFGEHAVVYQRPCLVTAVSSRIEVEIEEINSGFSINAPQVKDVRFIEETIKVFKERYKISSAKGLLIKTKSDFSSLYGFGSSSAVTVATITALSKIYDLNLTKEEIFKLGYQINLNVQKVGSGFDIAAAIFGGIVYFVTGGQVIEPIKTKKIPLVVGYSGVKADTPKIVQELKKKIDNKFFKKRADEIFDEIKNLTQSAKEKLIKADWLSLGLLMNKNQSLLTELGVSTKKLDYMCQAAIKAGAWGAKLSGAGGGDCMIALVSDEKRKLVEEAITQVGGQIINVSAQAEGVRVKIKI